MNARFAYEPNNQRIFSPQDQVGMDQHRRVVAESNQQGQNGGLLEGLGSIAELIKPNQAGVIWEHPPGDPDGLGPDPNVPGQPRKLLGGTNDIPYAPYEPDAPPPVVGNTFEDDPGRSQPASTDTRPRVVPNVPINNVTPAAEVQHGDNNSTDTNKGRLFSGNIRSSDDITRDINNTYKIPPKGPNGENREKSFTKRLFGGLWNGLEAWANSGDNSIAGLGAALGVGGAGSAASPKFYEGAKNFGKRSDLYNELGRTQQQEAFDAQQSKINIANQAALQKLELDPYWQYVEKKKSIDQDDADYLNKVTGIKFKPAQWQEYKDTTVNGKTFSRPEYSPNYERNTSVPIDPTEVPRDVEVAPGQNLPLTPKQAGPVIASKYNAEANRQQSQDHFEATQQRMADQFNISQDGKYQGDIRDYQKDLAKANAQVAENQPIAAEAESRVAELDKFISEHQGYDVSAYEKERQIALSTLSKAKGQIEAANIMLKIPKPAPPKKLSTGGKPKRSYTQDDINRVIRQ
jgi:hypothetical protein